MTGVRVPTSTDGLRLQTLERGLDALELLGDGVPRTVVDIGAALGLHRSVTYRIVRTLEERGYLERVPDGRFTLGLAAAALARGVRGELTAAAMPELAELADAVAATAFLVVRSGEEAVTLVSLEPRRSRAHVSHRPGQRHPLSSGAPGLAILAALPPRPDERADIGWARQTGWVRTSGEVLAGLSALAAPLRFADGSVAALCLVFVAGDLDERAAVTRLLHHARRLEAAVWRA
jgi:DNA-binding IclR family transcriptional regulator